MVPLAPASASKPAPKTTANARADHGLAGYWPLKGDARDHSGRGNHGINHAVDLRAGAFDGRGSYIEVPDSPALNFGSGDFSAAVWVYTEKALADVVGDILSKYDSSTRRGFSLSIKASSGGYNSHGNDKHVYFGIDNGKTTEWKDCGRPSLTSNYVSNSLTVFDGHLYAGTTDGATEQDWCHVYRYAGGARWEDCGRVGNLRTRGAGPMVVHDGDLYAGTWSYDWTRVATDRLDYGHVYRYKGGQEWEDCGQPGPCRRLFSLASFKSRVYVLGDDYKCHAYEGGNAWKVCGQFGHHVHPMAVHDGRLHVGEFQGIVLNGFKQAAVHAYDGTAWTNLGSPVGSEELADQIHALEVYRGKLYATTWPKGRVARFEDEGKWVDCGRPGDSTEINALTVYNGKLYAGSIPRAEVYRYEGSKEWTKLARFFAPEGWEPVPVDGRPTVVAPENTLAQWTRVTSLTVCQGRLFAGIGSCTSALADAPADVRGKVFAMRAGQCLSYDRDLGPEWKHLVAIRQDDRLRLYVDGRPQVVSPAFSSKDYAISNREPLKIGYGEMDYFSGKIREVRLYNRALSDGEIAGLASLSIKGW